MVTVDVSWTRQKNILPAARRMVTGDGDVVTLFKPHYEAAKSLLRKGVLPEEAVPTVVEATKADALAAGFEVVQTVTSPIKGTEGNVEVLCWLRPR